MKIASAADRWLSTPALPQRLALLRLLTGGFVLIYMLATIGEFARLTRRPFTDFDPIGLASVLDAPLRPGPFWSVWVLTLAMGLLFISGLRFRFSGPAFAAGWLFLASYHSSWGQMLHFEHLFVLHLCVLALAPAAAVWSLDSRGTQPPTAHVRFGWPIRLLSVITVVTYSIAGIAKLRLSGVGWADGENLANHIAYSATRLDLLGSAMPPLASWALEWSWMLGPFAVASLALELFAPIALTHRGVRIAWAVGVVMMHSAIGLMMGVWFPFPGTGVALVSMFVLGRNAHVNPELATTSRSHLGSS